MSLNGSSPNPLLVELAAGTEAVLKGSNALANGSSASPSPMLIGDLVPFKAGSVLNG